MITLDQIKAPVAQEVDNYHEGFREMLSARSEWLQQAIELLEQSTGKMVRPVLTCLTAGMLSGQVPSLAVDSGLLLELIHTATLIHDDVIDEAKVRRGKPTLGAIFDNRIAVLMGDFVLSSALIAAIQTRNLRIIGIVSQIGRELTEGEIRQYETAHKAILDEQVYFEVIKQKTAILFRSCAEVAAITADANEEDIQRVGHIAELLGLAFQIRDDIFDYYPSKDVGKPTGNDIREGKVTLPLLHCLLDADLCNTEEGQLCKNFIEKQQLDEEAISKLLNFAIDNGGIQYAEGRMNKLVDEAKELIRHYPDSVYRSSMLLLADYIIGRNK